MVLFKRKWHIYDVSAIEVILKVYPPQPAKTLFVLRLVVSRKNTENNDGVLQSKRKKHDAKGEV